MRNKNKKTTLLFTLLVVVNITAVILMVSSPKATAKNDKLTSQQIESITSQIGIVGFEQVIATDCDKAIAIKLRSKSN